MWRSVLVNRKVWWCSGMSAIIMVISFALSACIICEFHEEGSISGFQFILIEVVFSVASYLSFFFTLVGNRKRNFWHLTICQIKWLLKLSQIPQLIEVPCFSEGAQSFLQNLIDEFSVDDALEVKKIEKVTNHDVKAVEYFLKQRCQSHPEIVKVYIVSLAHVALYYSKLPCHSIK